MILTPQALRIMARDPVMYEATISELLNALADAMEVPSRSEVARLAHRPQPRTRINDGQAKSATQPSPHQSEGPALCRSMRSLRNARPEATGHEQ